MSGSKQGETGSTYSRRRECGTRQPETWLPTPQPQHLRCPKHCVLLLHRVDEPSVLQRLRLDKLELPQHPLCNLTLSCCGQPFTVSVKCPRRDLRTTAIPRPMHRISSELNPKPASTSSITHDEPDAGHPQCKRLEIETETWQLSSVQDPQTHKLIGNGKKEHGLVKLTEHAHSLRRTLSNAHTFDCPNWRVQPTQE